MNKYSYNGEIITASSKEEAIQKIVADSQLEQRIKTYETHLTSTNHSKYTSFYLVSGTKKERDDLACDFDNVVGNDDHIDVNFSLHKDFLQLNYDRLTKKVREFLKKDNFTLVFTQDNKKLADHLDQLKDMFEKEGYKITGDMGFEFQDSQDVPLYIDHFCVTFDEENDIIYMFSCDCGKFTISNYDEMTANRYSFEEAKKKCAELIKKYPLSK